MEVEQSPNLPAHSLAADGDGNAYVLLDGTPGRFETDDGGESQPAIGSDRRWRALTVAKYSNTGSLLWMAPIHAHSTRMQIGLEPDGLGGCYLMGFHSDSGNRSSSLDFGFEPGLQNATGPYRLVLGHIASKPLLSLTQTPAEFGSGDLSLILAGDPSQNYVVESSSDLMNWSTVTNIQDPRGMAEIKVDRTPSKAAQLFYRAVTARR